MRDSTHPALVGAAVATVPPPFAAFDTLEHTTNTA